MPDEHVQTLVIVGLHCSLFRSEQCAFGAYQRILLTPWLLLPIDSDYNQMAYHVESPHATQ